MFVHKFSRVSFTTGLNSHLGNIKQVIRCMSSFKNKAVQLEVDDKVCPQGIQGDNDANLQIWWKTCHRYGLENCDNQLENIQTGRKTLSDVLEEQNELIIQIAESYKKSKHTLTLSDSTQGIQDTTVLPSLDSPCPQGVQGDDCAQFKLWLENCHRFGFENCKDQLNDSMAGRKSLSDIFRAQERVIQSVVKQYKQQKRHYSTEIHADQTKKQIDKKIEKLSQKQRLKLAVKDYGSTVIVFHIGISLMSLGGFYLAVSSGIDMVGILTRLGVGESILQSKMVSDAGTFVVAYAVHKIFAPVRIAITLTSSPFIVRYLRQIGVLKVPKPK